MKPDKLSEISGEKYTVKECCIYKDKKKICNFYIKKLSLNYHIERLVSYTITLESEENECSATVPAYYIKDPSGWLYYGFEPEDFWCISGKDEFDRTINEIISLMKKKKNTSVKMR